MVLLSDFLKCIDDFEQVSCSDVLKRLNLYYEDLNEGGSTYLPFDFVGFTALSSDSPEDSNFVYLFRVRGCHSSYLFNYDFLGLLNSLRLYCRPKRAWRDWFDNVLLPH